MHTAHTSQISAVRLYRGGATVTRTLTLTVPLPEDIQVTGLPLSLLDNSVRVRMTEAEGGEVVVSGVRLGVYIQPQGDAPLAPEAAALQETQDQIIRLRSILAQLNQEIEALLRIEAPPRARGEDGRPPPPSPMAARVALERFTDQTIRARLSERADTRAELEALLAVAADQHDRLRRSKTANNIRPDEVSHTAVARLHTSGTPTRVVLAVDYFIPGARWAPTYQLMIDRREATATLKMRTLVAQRSGEDWDNVAVTFSTAAPMDDLRMPKLSAIRIGKTQPSPQHRGYRPPPAGTSALYGDFDRELNKARAALPEEMVLARIDAAPRALDLTVISPTASAPPSASTMEAEDEEEATRFFASSAPSALAGPGPLGGAPNEGAVQPPPPSPKAMASRSARRRSAKRAPMGGAAMKKLATPPPVQAKPRFADLRLPDANTSQRGKLTHMTAEDRIAQALQDAAAKAQFSIADQIRSARRDAKAAEQLVPQLRAGRFDYAYSAENPLDVPADGGIHAVPVLEWSSPCEMSYVVTPRVEPQVYRQVELINPSPAPLLPGPVEVYLDGQYAVTANLPLVGVRGKLSLGLGVEQAIRCARNCRFEERRSGEKVVAMTELLHDIEITLVNTLARPARCEVRERIPQPAADAEVVVEEASISPTWSVYSQKERGKTIVGGRRWNVSLPADQETVLTARYIVKIYANNELTGGNRREA